MALRFPADLTPPAPLSPARPVASGAQAAEDAGQAKQRRSVIAGFIVDFYCPSQRLVLELDGGVHDDPTQREHDQARTEILRQLSIRVLRVPNHDVHEQALRDLLQPYARPERSR